MLQVSDYNLVDVVSPFIGALLDQRCKLFGTAKITKSFTEYFDVVSGMYGRFSSQEWTAIDLDQESVYSRNSSTSFPVTTNHLEWTFKNGMG